MGSTKIKRILNQDISETTKPKLRVCAYCRVSTKSEEQLTSYETQVAVYTEKISSEPGWEFAGIYADRGTSATMMARRKEFLRMLEDCEKGLIDCVICKSLSRFARNTLDALNCIKKLRDLGVRLILEKEGIDTDMISSEILLSVFAAFAQEESHSHSENVRWGKRKRLQNGEPLLIRCYGYRKNEANDNIEIVPREAEAVRLIFDLYEHGISVPEITRILYEKGYTRPDGKDKVWDHSRIHYMIANEKYVGDIIAQKYYVKDYITHRSRLNNGALPSVYIKNHHEPIISRKQFERCNVILELKKRTAPLQYPYAEFFRCPYCGHVLRQRKLLIQNCYAHFCCEGEGACREFAIPSQEVEKAILKAYESLDLKEVNRIINSKNTDRAENAELLLQVKEKYPAFSKLDYWWLDDLVESISFGLHSHTASELKNGGIDDRTVSVHWKCGIITTLSSGVLRDSQDPRHKAELWNAYLLRYPSQFPELVEEVRKNK